MTAEPRGLARLQAAKDSSPVSFIAGAVDSLARIAGRSPELAQVADEVADELLDVLEGEPPPRAYWRRGR